jgi:hypothetical protein
MLLALCKHYDVTPTYLLDDERPIDPTGRDRWSERDGLVARGNWLEVPEGAMVTTHDGVRLVAVQPGSRFYDASAQAQRMTCPNAAAAKDLEASLQQGGKQRDRELEDTLSRELLGQRKPRNKPVAKSVLKSAVAQMAQG